MEIIPISEAKDRLTELADRAAREHDHFTLTRNGRPHAVIVSVAEWESLQETLEILADPEMRADLVEAAAAEERGDVTTEEEMANDATIRLTQETLADMLGVQRTTVTAVAKALQDEGLIRTGRGRIEILDRHRLERRACECHDQVEAHFQRMLPEVKT